MCNGEGQKVVCGESDVVGHAVSTIINASKSAYRARVLSPVSSKQSEREQHKPKTQGGWCEVTATQFMRYR